MASDAFENPAGQERPRLQFVSDESLSASRSTAQLHAVDVLERVRDAFVMLDQDWRIVTANRAACRLSQTPPAAFQGRTYWDEWPASVGTEVERQYRRAMAEQVEVHFEHRYVAGLYDVWIEVDAYPSRDGLAIFYRDITTRKQAEARLRESSRRLVLALESGGLGSWHLDLQTNAFLDVSAAYKANLGLTPDAPVNASQLHERIHPDDRDRVRDAIDRALYERRTYAVEYRLAWPDGTLHWIRESGRPIFGSDGMPSQLIGVTQEITQAKSASEALRRSREDLQLAIDAARLGTFYCDWPFDKITWNATCKEHFFLPLDADVDFDLFYALLHPDDREPTRAAIDRAMADHVEYNVEYRTLASDGRTRWINAVGRGYYDASGIPIRFDGITIDISRRKQAEEELRARAEREALLNRTGQEIRASLDTDVIQERVASVLGEALGADRCFYCTYDTTRDLIIAGRDHHRSDLSSIAGQYPLSAYRQVLDEQFADGTVCIEDVRRSPFSAGTATIKESFGQRALLAVPFFAEGTLVAALFVAMTKPRAWTPDEVMLVEQVATLTRTALETARIRRKERTIARQLQQALTPPIPAAVPGLTIASYYRPALDEAGVGGDFSDVFTAGDKSYLVIGDVAGKGLAAASQVATVRNMLRYALYDQPTLAGPVTRLNAMLTKNELLTGFATLFVGCYDAAAHTLTYVNCGQDAGLVLRAATGEIAYLAATGTVLGAIAGAEYTQEAVVLDRGDRVALFTDGLTEAGPTRTALLGDAGVGALFQEQAGASSPQDIVSGLMARVDAYAHGGVRDDQCLLVAAVL